MNLENFSLRSKLAFFMLLSLVAVAAVGLSGYYGIASGKAALAEIGAVRMPSLEGLMALKSGQDEVRIANRELIALVNHGTGPITQQVGGILERKQRGYAEILKGRQIYDPLPQTDQEALLWKEYVLVFDMWKQLNTDIDQKLRILAGLATDSPQRAGQVQMIQADFEQIVTRMARMTDLMPMVIDINSNVASTAYKESAAQMAGMIKAMILLGVAAFAIVLLLGLWISHSINKQLGGDPAYVRQIVERVAAGDFTVNVRVAESDHSSLLYAFRGMIQRLSEVLNEVSTMSQNLYAASEQVASAATELSSGSTRQAASVEQTSSSIEELTATVNQNSDNARVADGIASKAAIGATESGQSVANMVHSMKEIAGRITIINDIANKTDLLAINAAIEAARAGEHGKGFATVAVEVRKLAERSQVAAREIGDLAGKSVEVAEKAGTQLAEMLPGIDQTATLVQEIAAGSREQATGIRQINLAVSQISDTMQSTAASSEQLGATAEEMSASAGQLQDLMQMFKLRATHRSYAPPGNGNGTGNGAGHRDGHSIARSKRNGRKPAASTPLPSDDDDADSTVDEGKFSRF